MSISGAFFELLKVFPRVYNMRAPQNVQTPFVIYTLMNAETDQTLGGPSGYVQASIQVDVYAEDILVMRNLAQTLKNALDGFRGLVYYGEGSPQDVMTLVVLHQTDTELMDQTDEPFLYRNLAVYSVTREGTT